MTEPDAYRDDLLIGYLAHLPNPTPEQQARLAVLRAQQAARAAAAERSKSQLHREGT